ncbi:MAG: Flp pilus assembly protein CpaB [Polyangiaceae bacterium]
MNKRALLVAGIFAALGALLMILYVKRFEEEASGGERVRVLIAVKPLDIGEAIDEAAVGVREIPIAYVEDRFIKASEKSKVLNLKLGTKVEAQQTLMWTDLAIAADERRDLSGLIQSGARAVTIRASRGDKSYAMMRPGDYVDVIANLQDKENGDKTTAVVLLQKVLVLAVGLETAPQNLAEGAKERDMLLTLSVSLAEGQLLALAQEKGQMVVALRNPTDQKIVEGIPEMNSSALTDKEVIKTIQSIRSKAGPVRLEAK